jgi:hypothetical protein
MNELYVTSGYVFTHGGATVSWRSYKLTILTRSTIKAEPTTLDTSTIEADWLRELFDGLTYYRETFADNTYEL